MLFTERPNEEPDIRDNRVPRFFGRTREELLHRMGKVVKLVQAGGHDAPLIDPSPTLRLIDHVVDHTAADCKTGAPPHSLQDTGGTPVGIDASK